ncbi:MAG: hypothetical protein ACI8WB_005242 [Phenylobacterium sp.]|jgi:hypothetical protein
MKSFRILTLAATLVSTGVLMSTTVNAGTYSTTVNVDDLSTVIAWEETTGMQFATLLLDSNSAAGHSCYTYSSNVASNTLCPTSREGVSDSVFTVTGLPNANVGVQLDTTPQIIEGIRFVPTVRGGALVLDASGTADQTIGGALTLMDRAGVTSSDITFTYNLEFVGE